MHSFSTLVVCRSLPPRLMSFFFTAPAWPIVETGVCKQVLFIGDAPSARQGATAVPVIDHANDRMYVFVWGGSDGSHALSDGYLWEIGVYCTFYLHVACIFFLYGIGQVTVVSAFTSRAFSLHCR